MIRNWIRDRNRFALMTPPRWWLTALAEFDASLVILPSRVDPVYRLAQRRPIHERILDPHIEPHPDSRMLQSHGLVPVTTILSVTGGWQWSTLIFAKLAERAGWRSGLSWEKVADRIDAQDADERLARKLARDDRLDAQLRHATMIARLHKHEITGTVIAPTKETTQKALDIPLTRRRSEMRRELWLPPTLSPSGRTGPHATA